MKTLFQVQKEKCSSVPIPLYQLMCVEMKLLCLRTAVLCFKVTKTKKWHCALYYYYDEVATKQPIGHSKTYKLFQ